MLQTPNQAAAAAARRQESTINETENLLPTEEDDDNDALEINTEPIPATTYKVSTCAAVSTALNAPRKSNQYAVCSQIALLASLTIINFSIGSIVSIQAHNYPSEASTKGAVNSTYAFLFGLLELIIFLASPLYAKWLTKVKIKYLLNGGILTMSASSILFGLATVLRGKVAFIACSLLTRLVQALGEIGYILASFTIVAHEFPQRPGVIIISIALATMSGIGVFLGQYTGRTLIETGGAMMPYATFGSILNLVLFITSYLMPIPISTDTNKRSYRNVIAPVKIITIYLSTLTLIGGACCFGFGITTFIHHMKQFQLNRTQNMMIYVANILVIIVANPLWAWLCYKLGQTRILSIFAAIFICIAFSLHGPAPFLPFHASLSMSIIAVICQGIGIGGEVVCSCIGNINDVRDHGYPDDLGTKNLTFTLGCSGYYIGVFVGSSIGVLMSITVGYRMATFFIVIGHALLVVANGGYEIWRRRFKARHKTPSEGRIRNEVDPLITDSEPDNTQTT